MFVVVHSKSQRDVVRKIIQTLPHVLSVGSLMLLSCFVYAAGGTFLFAGYFDDPAEIGGG